MAYPAEVWTQVEYDYKTGNFSVAELAKKYEMPTATINKHFKTSGVVKGELVEKIRERKAEAFTRVFEQMGVNREFLVGKVKEFMEAKKEVKVKQGDKEAIVGTEDDRWAQEKGLTHYEKLCGIPEAPDPEAGKDRSPIEIKLLIVGNGIKVDGLTV